jgi:hypothetical protein
MKTFVLKNTTICIVALLLVPTLFADTQINRSEYIQRMRGFWLAQSIGNWTGLQTEGHKQWKPYYTDTDWSQFGFVLETTNDDDQIMWKADDDTDIEYIYLHAHEQYDTSKLTAEQIRDEWLYHIHPDTEKDQYIWVSNEEAWKLMNYQGMYPPDTSLPENNPDWEMIDAQLTTEIFGLLSPSRKDVALDISWLPVRTTAYSHSQYAAAFYIVMHSFASSVDDQLPLKDQVMWLSDQARAYLSNYYGTDFDNSYICKMYDWVKAEYVASDKDDWEKVRDDFHDRYIVGGADGYIHIRWVDSGCNFGFSIISWLFGEGDLKRTIQIGTLAGMDSDNPTATWSGLLGFMYSYSGVEAHFSKYDFSDDYWITRTRTNFPDIDTFTAMSVRAANVIDLVVTEQMGGSVSGDNWIIPDTEIIIDNPGYQWLENNTKTVDITATVTDVDDIGAYTYTWSSSPTAAFVAATPDVTSTETNLSAAFTFTTAGDYILKVQVDEGFGVIATATVTVTVYADGCVTAKTNGYTENEALIVGDANYDCQVNLADFAVLASVWMDSNAH